MTVFQVRIQESASAFETGGVALTTCGAGAASAFSAFASATSAGEDTRDGSETPGELAGAETSSGEGGASGLASGVVTPPPGAASNADGPPTPAKGKGDSRGAVSGVDSTAVVASACSAGAGLGSGGSRASAFNAGPVLASDVSV